MICYLFHFNLNHGFYREKEERNGCNRTVKAFCNTCLCLKIDLIDQTGKLKNLSCGLGCKQI